jgi:hypothetical protein
MLRPIIGAFALAASILPAAAAWEHYTDEAAISGQPAYYVGIRDDYYQFIIRCKEGAIAAQFGAMEAAPLSANDI